MNKLSMGKRQTRIFPNNFSQYLPNLINQEVNILLKNSKVFHGILKQNTGPVMQLTDMIGRQHIIEIQHISEIIVDKESPY